MYFDSIRRKYYTSWWTKIHFIFFLILTYILEINILNYQLSKVSDLV